MDARDDDRMPEREIDTRTQEITNRIERSERDREQDEGREKLEPSKDALLSCEKNMDEIERSGFSKELLDEIKNNPNVFLIDIKDEKDLQDYTKDSLSDDAKQNLNNMLKDESKNTLNSLKEYAVYSKMEVIEKDGINSTVSKDISSDKLKEDAREIVNKINDLKTRDDLDRKLEIPSKNSINKAVITDGRWNSPDRERYVSEKDRDAIEKTYQTRDVSDRYREERDLLDKWKIDKDDDRERTRAITLEKTIKDINLSPAVENYVLNMDKDGLKELMSNMNTRDDYEKFLDRVADSVRPEDKEALRDELHKNEVEKMATWTKDERDVGLAKEVKFRSFIKDMPKANSREDELNKNMVAFRETEEKLSKIADMDKDGRYIFPNKNDNITSRIDNMDKVKSVAAINLAMITRDEKDSQKFIEKNIDSKIDSKNPEKTANLIRTLSEDIRDERYQDALNKEGITNGDRIYVETVRLTEDKSNDIKPESEIEWDRNRFRVAELKEEDKINKGDLRSLTNLREIKEETRDVFEKQVFKDIPKDMPEKDKTSLYIEKLAEQKAIVAKFSNPIIERELTNGKGAERYGKEIEEKAQKYFETAKFADNKDLKDNIKEIIDNARSSPDKNEQKLAECFDFKDRISKAFIRGNLESIEADVRNDIGDIKASHGQMIYKDGMDKNDVEKTVRALVTQRAVAVPNIKDNKLEILLNERRNSDEAKEKLEKYFSRELTKDDVKIQGHLASMRYQEIVDRTAYALRSDNKLQAERDVNTFLKDTLNQTKIDADNKIIGNFADEKFNTLNYNTFVIGEFSGMSDNAFNLFNSSQLREIFIDDIKDSSDNDIREEYGNYDPRGDDSRDLDTPIRVTENSTLYSEALLSTFKEEGINLDPKIINIVPERGEELSYREAVLVEKEAMDAVREGRDTYKELDNGKFESRTLGPIDKAEAERLNEMFNNLFSFSKAGGMFYKDMNPKDAIELVARGEQLQPLLNPNKYEQNSEVFEREREIYNHNMSFLKDRLETRFNSAMKRESMFLEKADARFRNAKVEDLYKFDKNGKETVPGLRDYFMQRSEDYRAAMYKEEIIQERNRKDLREDVLRGIQDRRSPSQKQKDIVEKEINELRQEKFRTDRKLSAVERDIRAAQERHQVNLRELENKRDEQLKGLKDGFFAKIKRIEINTNFEWEKNKLEEALNKDIEIYSNIGGFNYKEELAKSVAIKDRIESLNQSMKVLTRQSIEEIRDDNIKYANIQYDRFVRSLVEKENTLVTKNFTVPILKSENRSKEQLKDSLIKDIYDYKTRNLMETKLNNKIEAARVRIRNFEEEEKSLRDLAEYRESPEGVAEQREYDDKAFYYEMERSAKDINHVLDVLREKEPQTARDLGVYDLRMPENPKDPAMYDVLNNTFVKYLDVQIYDRFAYDKLEKLLRTDAAYQRTPEKFPKEITQEKIDEKIEGWKVSYGYRDLSKDELRNVWLKPPTKTLLEVKAEADTRQQMAKDLEKIEDEYDIFDDSYIDEDSYNDLYDNNYEFPIPDSVIEEIAERESQDEEDDEDVMFAESPEYIEF